MQLSRFRVRLLSRALEANGIHNPTRFDPARAKQVRRVKAAFDAKWRQRHRRLPLAKWRARADLVERQPNPLVAMARYQALRNDMAYLEEALGEAAYQLESYIQMEIDRARGK